MTTSPQGDAKAEPEPFVPAPAPDRHVDPAARAVLDNSRDEVAAGVDDSIITTHELHRGKLLDASDVYNSVRKETEKLGKASYCKSRQEWLADLGFLRRSESEPGPKGRRKRGFVLDDTCKKYPFEEGPQREYAKTADRHAGPSKDMNKVLQADAIIEKLLKKIERAKQRQKVSSSTPMTENIKRWEFFLREYIADTLGVSGDEIEKDIRWLMELREYHKAQDQMPLAEKLTDIRDRLARLESWRDQQESPPAAPGEQTKKPKTAKVNWRK